jgi:hypothetical protein
VEEGAVVEEVPHRPAEEASGARPQEHAPSQQVVHEQLPLHRTRGGWAVGGADEVADDPPAAAVEHPARVRALLHVPVAEEGGERAAVGELLGHGIAHEAGGEADVAHPFQIVGTVGAQLRCHR